MMAMTNKFKIGDKVRGSNRNNYSITGREMTLGEVVALDYDQIKVKVLQHTRYPSEVGGTFWVDHKFFELVEQAVPTIKKDDISFLETEEGTYVVINNKYTIFTKATKAEIGIVSVADIKPSIETAKAIALSKVLAGK